ncbi:uncharacterized protein LOC109829411 [Asparagus officinalis]|uniref:uncharacterized protein LOC109829411 n=1 Tax=Asparagus officinalis TaxID=4686 RepID=UPI00098E4F7C|nr:uncharacterized protein LOC109829411 [Asparagus officinalis]
MNKIQRTSSIEREPQTLLLDQIKDARETALYVIRNHSIEEAIRIFTEGLQPVLSVKNGDTNVNMRMDSDEDRVGFNHVLAGFRDTATAPF